MEVILSVQPCCGVGLFPNVRFIERLIPIEETPLAARTNLGSGSAASLFVRGSGITVELRGALTRRCWWLASGCSISNNSSSFIITIITYFLSNVVPRAFQSCHLGWPSGSSAIPASAPVNAAASNFGFPLLLSTSPATIIKPATL